MKLDIDSTQMNLLETVCYVLALPIIENEAPSWRMKLSKLKNW